MKKSLLFASVMLGATLSQAQITTYVLQPASLEGPLDFTWADNWGMTPDLNDPANMVVEFAAFVDDGTAGDSLGCNALVNGADISGKIAVLYRGTCEFGLKALNAQNAGALAVVIVNNIAGGPVAMGGGASGANVSIPVVMVTDAAGASLRSEIIAGNVEMRIGSVQDLYQFNLNVSRSLALVPANSAQPKWLAADAAEYSQDLGTWVKNFGSENQTDVTVSGVITQDGTEVYNNTSAPGAINSGDSAFFALPLFSQSTYSGYYEGTYTINSTNPDEFTSDDSFGFNMLVDSIYGFARIDPATRRTTPSGHYRPGGTPAPPNFTSCIHFRDPNGSRVKIDGLYTSASKSAGASVDGEVLEASVIEWNDVFTGLDNAALTNLATLTSADYFYDSDLSSEVIYIPFIEPLTLEDDQRYLFCVFSPSDSVFLGYDETLDYTKTQDIVDEPISLISDNGTWYLTGFGSDVISAIGARMSSAIVGINENDRVEVTPYPNPTTDFIRIPLKGQSGAAVLQMFDLEGRMVAEQKVSVAGNGVLTVDVTDISTGTYLFNMNFEDGKFAGFRVVVTK
ncbi:MAG: PA domain-containing protein [Flavobacteriales bacterium]